MKNKKKEDKLKTHGRNTLIIILATLKSFWDAIMGVVWGLGGIFLLIGLIGYFKVIPDQSMISLLETISLISAYWKWCFVVLFFWYLFVNLKERKAL